ncbi:MAG: alpha/beta hydrolase [Solobacterium sp.]|nr:alpha/beta hydrolase [Solobacterium sp.]
MKRKMTAAVFAACMLLCSCAEKQESKQQEETMSIPIETVQTEDFTMDYFRFGTGKKTMVILPGLSVQSVMGLADAVADAYKIFAEDYTVYLFERRKELPEGYTIDDMTKDAEAAFEALDLKDIYLFGTSQGGMIALDLAVQYPERIKKVAVGSAAASMTGREAEVDHWLQLAKEGKAEELYLAFGKAINPESIFEPIKDLYIAAAKTVTKEELERFVTLCETMRGFDITGDLNQINCPVLVIGAEDDHVLGSEAAREIAQHLPQRDDCVLYMYDGYGHAAYDNAPDYKERLYQFFSN